MKLVNEVAVPELVKTLYGKCTTVSAKRIYAVIKLHRNVFVSPLNVFIYFTKQYTNMSPEQKPVH